MRSCTSARITGGKITEVPVHRPDDVEHVAQGQRWPTGRGPIEQAMIGVPYAGDQGSFPKQGGGRQRYRSRWSRGPACCPVLRSVHRLRGPLAT